jgi:hypothetical protein
MGLRKWLGRLACPLKTFASHPPDFVPGRQSTSFADLPPELVQHIVTFLPTSSAAALALCNHRISSALGTQHWKALGSRREAGGQKPEEIPIMWEGMADEPPQTARSDFLCPLERDLPQHIFCRRCELLHLLIFEPYTSADCSRLCAIADLRPGGMAGLSRQTCFPLLQWIMRRHRMGLDRHRQVEYLFDEDIRIGNNLVISASRVTMLKKLELGMAQPSCELRIGFFCRRMR